MGSSGWELNLEVPSENQVSNRLPWGQAAALSAQSPLVVLLGGLQGPSSLALLAQSPSRPWPGHHSAFLVWREGTDRCWGLGPQRSSLNFIQMGHLNSCLKLSPRSTQAGGLQTRSWDTVDSGTRLRGPQRQTPAAHLRQHPEGCSPGRQSGFLWPCNSDQHTCTHMHAGSLHAHTHHTCEHTHRHTPHVETHHTHEHTAHASTHTHAGSLHTRTTRVYIACTCHAREGATHEHIHVHMRSACRLRCAHTSHMETQHTQEHTCTLMYTITQTPCVHAHTTHMSTRMSTHHWHTQTPYMCTIITPTHTNTLHMYLTHVHACTRRAFKGAPVGLRASSEASLRH